MTDIQLPLLGLLAQVSRQAVMIVLLMYLGYLPSAVQLEQVLGIERRTIRAHLTYLEQCGLIRRVGLSWGYALALPLSAENKLLLSLFIPNRAVLAQVWDKNVPSSPLITTTADSTSRYRGESAVVAQNGEKVPQLGQNIPILRQKMPKYISAGYLNKPPAGCSPELWQALNQAHIGGKKRRSLAQRADLTPQQVRLWEQYLRKTKGEKYTPGLLIYVLEAGDPPPEINENGHLLGCECKECTFKADDDIKW